MKRLAVAAIGVLLALDISFFGAWGQTYGPPPSGSSPCSAFGTTSGTCVQGSAVGSWTPAITASGTAGTPAYTTQVGSVVQTNNSVQVWFSIVLSGWTGSPSGNVTITGLPVQAGSTANDYGGCVVHAFAVSSSVASMAGNIAPGTSVIAVTYVLAGGSSGASPLTETITGTTPTLRGYCAYHT